MQQLEGKDDDLTGISMDFGQDKKNGEYTLVSQQQQQQQNAVANGKATSNGSSALMNGTPKKTKKRKKSEIRRDCYGMRERERKSLRGREKINVESSRRCENNNRRLGHHCCRYP
uniref:BZIP domain-containing protein n=1 Tax=Trichogramma kaykai TaxID=54128 RepID=A0ABD2WUY9_9HYME